MVHNVDVLSNPKEGFWKLSAPFILLSIFEAAYSLIDMFWVSQLSQEAFFVIGVTAPLLNMIISFGSAIGLGVNSLISRELGRNDIESSYNSILHGLIACAILTVMVNLGALFLPDILALMHVTNSVDLAIEYLTPQFLFAFTILFSSLFVSTLQAEGNSKTPTRVLVATNILNLILDPILIFVLDWGITGAAYSSIISTGIGTIFFLYWYLSGRTRVVLNFKYFKPGILYEIFIVAIPSFITEILWCICIMYVNRILMEQLGNIGVLIYSTTMKIDTLMVAPQTAFGKSMVSISGQLFGASRIDDLKEIYHYALMV